MEFLRPFLEKIRAEAGLTSPRAAREKEPRFSPFTVEFFRRRPYPLRKSEARGSEYDALLIFPSPAEHIKKERKRGTPSEKMLEKFSLDWQGAKEQYVELSPLLPAETVEQLPTFGEDWSDDLIGELVESIQPREQTDAAAVLSRLKFLSEAAQQLEQARQILLREHEDYQKAK